MSPLTPADLPPLEVFEAQREAMRVAVIAHKAARRVALGDRVTVLFEDRETIRWQVLEMCRVEGIRDAAGMADELAVYNELVPGPGELSATLFIEITEAARIRSELDRLIGLHEHVALEIGGARVLARFDTRQLEEERISAVHYLRFTLAPTDLARFADPKVPVALVVDHPGYAARAELPRATRASLAVDLRGDPEPVFRFTAGAAARPLPAVLAARGRVRAVALPKGLVRVEAVPAAPPLAELSADLALELLALAREIAAASERAGRACELVLDPAAPHAAVEVRPSRR